MEQAGLGLAGVRLVLGWELEDLGLLVKVLEAKELVQATHLEVSHFHLSVYMTPHFNKFKCTYLFSLKLVC